MLHSIVALSVDQLAEYRSQRTFAMLAIVERSVEVQPIAGAVDALVIHATDIDPESDWPESSTHLLSMRQADQIAAFARKQRRFVDELIVGQSGWGGAVACALAL